MSSGTATALLFVPIVLWSLITQLWLVSICYRKNKVTLARIGLVGMVVPGLFVFPLVGASRLAMPSSSWAVMHYGDEFMGRAARRYPDDHEVAVRFSLPKRDRTLWEKLVVGGLILTALGLILLFGETAYTGFAAVVMLIQLMAITWLAEVELTAKRYSAASARMTDVGTTSVPALH